MAEDTIMVLKVDLECARCYKKIKKLLRKFPEIRDQIFNEKEDAVIIKVVCCNPERIRSKLIRKGGETIKSIEIKVPQKPPASPEKTKPQADKPKEDDQKTKPQADKPKEEDRKTKPHTDKAKEDDQKKKPQADKPKEDDQKTKPQADKPKEDDQKTKPQADKPKEDDQKTKPQADKPKEDDQKPTPKPEEKPLVPVPTPVTGYPPLIYPIGVCCKPCYEGRGGGPCHHGYEIPYKPPSYEGYVKLVPSNDGWPSGCRCNRSYGCSCEYFIEENPTCTIM